MALEAKPSGLHYALAQFSGSEHYYQHLHPLLLTDGSKFLADEAGCYWLMDIVALRMCPALAGKDSFFVVDVERRGRGVTLTAHDGGLGEAEPRVYYREDITLSDFPLEHYAFYVAFEPSVSRWVAMLTSEY